MTQEQRQSYEKIYKLVIDLQKKYWPYEGEKDKNQALSQVINFTQILGIPLEPTDSNFLPTVAKKILEELFKPLEQEAPSIPANLKDFVLEMDEARAKEEARKEKLMAEAPRKTYNYFFNRNKEIVRQNYPNLPPTAIDEVSREITKDIIDKLPVVARPDLLKPEDYQQAINKNLITEKLKNAGLEPKENISEKFLANFEAAKKIAAEPEIIKSIKEEGLKVEKPPDKEATLPPETLRKFNQKPETQTFAGLYTFFDGQAGSAAFLTAANRIPALMIKNAVKNASPETKATAGWQEIEEIVRKNIFVEDYEATIKALGLPEDHPFVQRIRDKMARLKEVQKNILTQKDYGWVRVLKRNRYWGQIVGRTEGIYDEELGIFLAQSPVPNWTQEGTYAYSLRQTLNKFNFIPNSSKKTFRFLTGGRYESFGGTIRGTIYQRGIKPLFIRFGKTAVGQATGKIFAGLSTRLAVRLGLGALTAGWGTFITALPLIKRLAKKALAIVGGLLLWAAHYGTAAVLGTLAGSLGGAIGGGILGFKMGALIGTSFSIVGTVIGAIVGFVIGAIIGFFSGIGLQLLIDKIKSSLSSPLLQKVNVASREIASATVTTSGNVVLGTIAGVGVATLLVTQITSSAFLIPEGEEFAGSPYIQLDKTGKFDGNQETGEGVITYQVSVGAQDENLIEVKISDEISTRCLNDQLKINSEAIGSPPEIINIGDSWETTYTIKTEESFKDCLIINKITVLAKIESLPEEIQEKTITYVIKIGNPPEDCPYGWPTSGIITSLPGEPRVGHTHAGVDIANKGGTPIYSTHGGSVSSGPKEIGGAKGNYIEIIGTCGGKIFQTVYYHLSVIKISSGDIPACSEIGLMGNTGNSYGENGGYHLHYEIRQLGDNWWTSGEYFPKPRKYDQVTSSCF